MDSLIENYINGNLTEAKRQAKRFGHQRLYDALRDRGYGHVSAKAIAHYLKGTGTFQAACDAEHSERTAAQ